MKKAIKSAAYGLKKARLPRGVFIGAIVFLAAVLSAAVLLKPARSSADGIQVAQASAQDQVMRTVNQWARAWEKSIYSIEEYAAFYDKEFYSHFKSQSGMNYNEWIADKKAKGLKSTCLEINVSDISVEITEEYATANFMQQFVSNTSCDKGWKTLYLKKRGDEWKIVGEEQPKVAKCDRRCK